MNNAQKVAQIVEHLASSDTPLGISEISKVLGIGKSNTSKIIYALQDQGWLQQQQDEKYSLTGVLIGLGSKVAANMNVITVSNPFLYLLHNSINETVSLSTRLEYQRVYVSHVPSTHGLRAVVPLGKRLELWYGGASAKAILAFMKDDEIETVLKRFKDSGMSVLASGQAISVEILKEQIEKIRRDQYAISVGENNVGMCSLAAPIFGHKNEIIGALGISGPIFRFTIQRAEENSALIVELAQKISSIMGAKAIWELKPEKD
jgi:IclR family KDG regulon transcriptional repressor